MRADVFLAERGYAESRNRAARLIGEGKVLIDGKPVCKASENIGDGEHEVVITEKDRYVGRGGLKLEAALDTFKIVVEGKRCIDVGASTGGFTDCLLQRGALSVLALDSGRGQLHPSLLSDRRVASFEGQNAREMTREEFGCFDIAVMDVSFISQTIIHPNLADILCDGAVFISLIKPQFEAGRAALGKGGIVKEPRDRERAIFKVAESAAACSLELTGLIRSPIEGGDGNVEYLACFVKITEPKKLDIGRFDIKSLCRNR